MDEGKRLELEVEASEVYCYAFQQNNVPLIGAIKLINNTEESYDNLYIEITSGDDLLIPYKKEELSIQGKDEQILHEIDVRINGDILVNVTEQVISNVQIRVCQGETLLASKSLKTQILPFDNWPGFTIIPEFLTTFVTPNHPVVIQMLQSTSKWLGKWTKNPSLEGYQSGDPDRVLKMAAAAYAAMQECNITYSNPPASFDIGQRIRLCDAIMDQHFGTCMDLTLMYAAILEGIGLHPFLVLCKGHIFAGVWLIDDCFSEQIVTDPSQIEKRMAEGINEVVVVECTTLCAGQNTSFEDSVNIARRTVSNFWDFQFVIDVTRARKRGIHPLATRIKSQTGYKIEHTERKEEEVTSKPSELGHIFDLSDIDNTPKEVTKQTQWERKLLDLSMRNMLINMRLTSALVPLLASDIGDIEDALSDGESFQVTPRPMDLDLNYIDLLATDSSKALGPFKESIELECKHKRIPSVFTEAELNRSLTKMYRSAKTSLEENGASTLYLALGLLRWYEKKTGEIPPRYAPIVLIPIEITRKSASKGYTMCMRDDDAQINITLLEFLKQSFDISIGGLDPIPTDEHGLDLKKIYAIIRRAIMDEEQWDVVEAAFIGNFSFSQFVMWSDIHNRPGMLEKNKIVRSLINSAIDWDCTIPDSIGSDHAYLPITADESQLKAINMAANDVSFVLHGPPGTGKSQTITAMIANALTKGKTVLFVAEKMAALEVVQKRLASLGVGDFCLELHSNKATKKAVLNQLKRGLEIKVWGFETQYDNKIEDMKSMRAVLDSYANAIHKQRVSGKSLRDYIDLYEMIPECEKEATFGKDYIESLAAGTIEQHKNILERMVAAGREMGHPSESKLKAIHQTVYSQEMKFSLENLMWKYQEALLEYKKVRDEFVTYMNVNVPITEEQNSTILTYAKCILSLNTIPAVIRSAASVDSAFAEPYNYTKKLNEFTTRKEFLLGKWNPNFLKLDMNIFSQKYDAANKKFLGKGKAQDAVVSEMQSYALFPVAIQNVPALLTDVRFYQQEEKELMQLKESLHGEWPEILKQYDTIQKLDEYKLSVEKQMKALGTFEKRVANIEAQGQSDVFITCTRNLIKKSDAVAEIEGQADELLKISFDSDNGDYIQDRIKLCENVLENGDRIKDWVVYRKYVSEAKDAGLKSVCDLYEDGLPHEEVVNTYLKSIFKAIILQIIEAEPILNEFNGVGFNERILQFKKLDQDFMDLTKDEIYYKLTHQLPTGYESVEIGKELNILRKAIASNGRGMSIRSLFEQIPNVLKHLAPCMLMSPISVAQYLATNDDPFDIVIFDEASQLPTCKAVGVLARGKNAVIVGDPNQMPPTSFFAGNTIDEDNLDIEDLDSILDDCLALGMPQTHLQWHYRSKHESLIAFSNLEFYENKMLTFPSVNDRERHVTYKNVKGHFDRGKGRVNRAEAEAVIKEIMRRYQDVLLKSQSIGVVTFNISQQTLIEDMLQEEYRKDTQLDSWANAGADPLFVKNLENVQGDERDVILFSLAFGPDEDGKFSMNFGPLNKEGGWKRLNVAVSRAKYEMVVFSVMNADMIDLKRTKSKGVEALKSFLAYAEKGLVQGEHSLNRKANNQGIMQTICQELEKRGYEYQTYVGHSNFKIDVAVINPYNKDDFLLGILFDGESYYQAANTKDREISQVSLLNALGWTLTRIWSMDWWDNKEKELTKLFALLDEKKEEAEKNSKTSSPKEIEEIVEVAEEGRSEEPDEVISDSKAILEGVLVFECDERKILENATALSDTITTLPMLANEYRCEAYDEVQLDLTEMSTAAYISKDTLASIIEKIENLIKREAPISQERIIRKILKSYGIGRSSAQTIEATEKALKKVHAKGNKQNGLKYYWAEEQNPEEYTKFREETAVTDKRTMDDITQQELKNAICITLKNKGPLTKENLIKKTIRTMGYSRSGNALIDAVNRGLKHGKKTGEIQLNENKEYYLKQ